MNTPTFLLGTILIIIITKHVAQNNNHNDLVPGGNPDKAGGWSGARRGKRTCRKFSKIECILSILNL